MSDIIPYDFGKSLQVKTCFKCGKTSDLTTIVTHHIRYNPEVVVNCCKSCHTNLHQKIRKTNKCPLSVKETLRLSHNSASGRYSKHNFKRINFRESLADNVNFHEQIIYNTKLGEVYYWSGFNGNNGQKLYYINEVKK